MVIRKLFTANALGAVALVGAAAWVPARGQEPEGPIRSPAPDVGQPAEPDFPKTYTTLDAGREAHERAERKRRQTIDAQVNTIEDLAWYGAWFGRYRFPPSLAARYAYPYGYPVGPGRLLPRPFSRAFRSYPGVYGPVFEPWPFVPGDIWAYPYVSRVEQPLGHKVIQTGPNSYIYRPVYESDLKPAAPQQPPGTAERPAAGPPQAPAGPPEEIPAPEPIPAPPPEPVPPANPEPPPPGPRVF